MKSTFIEASAGTGKTYTIMEYLSKWMLEHKNDIDNILTKVLILTFTEKAAGELKERLRNKILELKKESKEKELDRYILELDQVTISTIHGFCNMVLREYPVETNSIDEWQITDVKAKIKDIFYELKHNEWKHFQMPEGKLSQLLIVTNFFDQYEETISNSAIRILSGRSYNIENEIELEFKGNLEEFEISFAEFALEVNKYTQSVISEDVQSILMASYRNDTFSPYWKKLNEILNSEIDLNLQTKIVSILKLFSLSDLNGDPNLENFIITNDSFQKKALKTNSQEKYILNNTEILKKLRTIIKSLNSILPAKEFIYKTVLYIVGKINETYKSSKAISYDHMVLQVRNTLATNKILVEALQKRFTICMLDEFQDTDLVQYEIFKMIFLDPNTQNHFLYMIGDPKQSIYGFRGADLGTYLQAKKEIGKENHLTLKTNYRSVKSLIQATNEIFNQKGIFFPIEEVGISENQISFEPVEAPPDHLQKVKLSDKFNKGPIHIIKFNEGNDETLPSINKALAEDKWNQFIANEIIKLSKDNFCFLKNDSIVNLKYSDIAILVKNRKTGIATESVLRKHGIPCTFYKQTGIYQSREADQMINILECLLDPNKPSSYRKLLLCDLFQINPNQLIAFDEHSIDSYEKQTLDKWRKLIQTNQFGEFFRRIEEDTRIFFSADDRDLSWERRRTNYRQILQRLLEYQITNQANLSELLTILKMWKSDNRTEDEQPLFDIETESDTIKILTIHASKGLEWPVVFVNDFSSPPISLKDYDYPSESEMGRIWKLSLWEEDKNAYYQYKANEDKRLLYVALTRPQVRLYLPYIQLKDKKGSYSQFLFKAISSIENKVLNGELKDQFTFRNSKIGQIENLKVNLSSEFQIQQGTKNPLICLDHSPLNQKRRIFLHSYSSLKKGIQKEYTRLDEEMIQLNEEVEVSIADILPSSANMGTFLHKLLEEINFSEFDVNFHTLANSNIDWNSILDKNILKFDIETEIKSIQNGKSIIHQMIYNTIHTKLELIDQSNVSLRDIEESNMAKEMDFSMLIEESEIKGALGNFLKGSIDLVFSKNGKYYIADYKSDKLFSYEEQFLMTKIYENNYNLQRDFYAYVFFTYLKSLSDEKTALSQFGGVYYLFLRGMDPKKKNMGIYSDLGKGNDGAWDKERFAQIEENIKFYINRSLGQIPS